MTAHRTTSDSTGVRALLPTRRTMGGAHAAVALASALLLGGSVPALATGPTDPPNPAVSHVWAGCELSPATLEALAADAAVEVEGTAQISFVVVYTLSNDNDGQLLGESGFTGPVLCTNPFEVGITALQKDGTTPLTETSDIPAQTDPGGATTVDILEAEEAFIIKYRLDNGANAEDIEKRVCHTVDGNVDCFIIFPSSTG
jgi:hypothetical protein